MGPTPPGTGVILETNGRTPEKSTSPTSRYPVFFVGSSTALIPTSTMIAPGLTQSAFTW
jgi:hypothetical protein